MNARAYAEALFKRWRFVVGCVVGGVLTGVLVTSLSTPVYQGHSQIFVSARAVADTQQLAQVSSFGQDRVQSYADLVTSRPVMEQVIAELDLAQRPDELATKVKATSPLGTVLINISTEDPRPDRAADIANAVARHLVSAVGELETPVGGGAIPVKLSVSQSSAVPAVPDKPRPLLNLAAGTFGGLLLGLGLALLREVLDSSVSGTNELAEVVDAPVFGSIPLTKGEKSRTLVLEQEGYSRRAEAYRQLRTNLQFAGVDGAPTLIAVSSALPGEGKTSTAANLAAALALEGRTVCLVDADLRRPQIAGGLGLVAEAGLTSVLIGQATLDDVLQSGPGGLRVLTSGPVPPNPAELLASGQMSAVLKELRQRFDSVVVDTAPVLPVADTVGLVPQMDGVVLVVRARKTGRDQALGAAQTLRGVGGRLIGTVLSMTPEQRGPGGYGSYGSYGSAASYGSYASHGQAAREPWSGTAASWLGIRPRRAGAAVSVPGAAGVKSERTEEVR
ncbi:polysaccharide biosynthesis tyrosine autokinase [Streptomyces sp. NBC_00237]|uniref:polysaccharide biosynthesis tyrosine autokinase n=1 Tax=Streptomyces sp. NBC_00237 TaxID=2975687 RepID=UPI002257CC5E|nr:polysaccharide biosynthesis tyrosine autokinase [Streptomyces sp. NBC_00237]MCX5200259.1 polysaccharide biosynthesis tyrosine autokinase [Streptomyces sp. NBC_00237]